MRVLPRSLTPTVGLLCFAVAIAATFSAAAEGPQTTPRPMTVDDVLRMARLGNVLISPDGTASITEITASVKASSGGEVTVSRTACRPCHRDQGLCSSRR